MPYEDFLTYVEYDPNSHITVAEHHIDHLAFRNEDAYVYKDKGANYFGDFLHFVDIKANFNWGLGIVWSLQNDIDDAYGLHLASKTFICVNVYNWSAPAEPTISLREGYGGVQYVDSWPSAVGSTWYYLVIQKIGTALTCKIYSDSARTVLLKTLSLTLQADHKFRYIFGCNTWNSGHNYAIDCDIENLDLSAVIVTPKKRILRLFPTIGIALEDINISKGDRVIVL